jgi:hypothetical protein
MAVSLVSTGVTFPDNSTQTTAATGFGFKNRIINGAMVIDQRNAGASVTPNNSYTLDRWVTSNAQTSKFTVEQTITGVSAPVGFTDYLAVTSSSAYSVLTGDYFAVYQPIEGFNVADFAWGTASAATVTLSFWIRSSLTGTFGGSIRNSAGNRSYPFTYTISAANTWEQKTITIAGDTSGTWATNNTNGMSISFGLGAGSTFSGTAGAWAAGNFISATGATSVVGTNGATFYITGVQLEKGSTATSFDYRPYSTELQLCQRYLPAFSANGATYAGFPAFGMAASSTSSLLQFVLPVSTRVPPTGVTVSAASHFHIQDIAGAYAASAIVLSNNSTFTNAQISVTASGVTTYRPVMLQSANASALIYFTGCEL